MQNLQKARWDHGFDVPLLRRAASEGTIWTDHKIRIDCGCSHTAWRIRGRVPNLIPVSIGAEVQKTGDHIVGHELGIGAAQLFA